MTNELEKQFFDTFGIENKEIRTKDCDCCSYYEAAYDAPCYVCTARRCPYVTRKQPQITDSILLELIRIIGKKPFGYLQCENTYSTNLGDTRDMITVEADSLKEGLLTLAMQNKVVLRIKHQVRTLFEEG